MDTKRAAGNFNPDPPPFDRRQHATTLRGVLEGLERQHNGIFATAVTEDVDDVELDAADMGEIVLKITGRVPFQSGAFAQWSMRPLAANDDKQFFVLSDADSRARFREFATSYDVDPESYSDIGSWRSILENIEGIELYGAEDRNPYALEPPSPNETIDVDIVLWPTSFTTRGADKEAQRRVQVLNNLIEHAAVDDHRLEVLASDTNPDTLLIHARVDAGTFQAITEHPYVEIVRGPLAVEVSASNLRHGEAPSESPLPEGAPIGIIDDLVVDANPWLTDVIVEQRSFPDSHSFGDHTSHGTQVAGLAAWGSIRKLLDDPDYDGQPHPVYVARVAQANQHFEVEVVGNAAKQVSAALDWLAECGVRIVVCAFAFDHADNGAMPSDLSAVVDAKARDHGLVVVVSAGNLNDVEGGRWKQDYPAYLLDPSSAVAAPGSAALAVTTGAVAHTDTFDRTVFPNGVAIARAGEAAPYTRTGPSRGVNATGRQKPEFAAHGGSWAWDQATSAPITTDANLGAVTLIPPNNGRLFATAAGTSYAAPLVAHEIARIATRYPDAGPNLLRALTALAGQRPPSALSLNGQPLFGTYGIPDAGRVLESGGNRAIFVYEGSVATNSHTAIEIPVPVQFATGSSEREVRVAVAFDPPVRRSRRDYIAGKITFELTHQATLAEIREAYAKQPTERERKADASKTFHAVPPHKEFRPPKTRLTSDTLICRTYWKPNSGWDPDDGPYHLILTHDHSPWTPTQKGQYPTQTFAVAIEMVDIGRTDLDLHALAEAQLQARTRVRGS